MQHWEGAMSAWALTCCIKSLHPKGLVLHKQLVLQLLQMTCSKAQ